MHKRGTDSAKVGTNADPMKRLYQTLLDNEARVLGEASRSERRRASVEDLEAIERRLGYALPKTYKSFAREVGEASWPLRISAADALAPYPAELARPSWLLPFASDESGNDHCFDTRVELKGEYAIESWDHESPPSGAELEERGTPMAFDDWLKGVVNEKIAAEESEALAERHRRIEALLLPHRPTNAWPFAPSADDVAKVEAGLRFALPKDYVWLTTTLGSLAWPLEIVDALEIGRLTEEMKRQFPNARGVVAAIGREADGSFVGVQKFGKLVAVGGRPLEDATFLDFLERRIDQRSRSKLPPPMSAGAAPKKRGKKGVAEAAPAPVEPSDEQIPWRIVDDERINSVWRAVAESKNFSATKEPDGRIQVVIEDFMMGKRRMFLDADAWAVVEKHLAARKK